MTSLLILTQTIEFFKRMRSFLEREVEGSDLGPVKSDRGTNGSPPQQHFLERSCVACMRYDAEMGPANSLHASA